MNRRVAAVGTLIVGVLGVSGTVPAQTPAPALVKLSSEPLYLSLVKPTLTLLLSVEYPTVSAAYVGATGYTPDRDYQGYFDTNGCYDYDVTKKYFVRTAPALLRACDGTKFSGNFMNWSTASAIDMLRYSLTGGDRVIDEPGLTVLQRAVLMTKFYNNPGYYFPKQLAAGKVADGALPAAVRNGYTGTIFVGNCLNRIVIGTQATGTCTAPGANANLGGSLMGKDGYFWSRVQVCDVNDAASRPSLCALQRSGYYKPIGNLQRYSDRIRVAVFGYLKDDRKSRYGGVLRAPMKYVGPQHFDSDYKPLVNLNPAREWDDTTGVFFPNPDGAAEGASGAINYLNQFGRSGQYKESDPAAELFYEALRYLQGMQPTPAAVADVPDAQKDGFPFYATWKDPHPPIAGYDNSKPGSYACVPNAILGIGDVRTNADRSLPGNTLSNTYGDGRRPANPDNNEPDLMAWTRLVGGFETGEAMSYVDSQGINRVTRNPSTRNPDNANLDTKPVAWGPYNFGAGFYIAGAAYWAHTHDIRPYGLSNYDKGLARPGMRVNTYMIDVNEAGAETSEKAFKQNQFYLAAKYGGFTDRSGIGNPFLNKDGQLDNATWSRPVSTTVAADGLVAKTYFQGSDVASLRGALDNIFAEIVRQGASVASGAIGTTRLTTETALFSGSFDTADWSGDVMRYRVTLDAKGQAVVAGPGDPTNRSAAAELNKLPNVEGRKIFIGRSKPDAKGAANEFKWDSLDADQKEALRRAPAATVPPDDEATGRQRVAYLRGDRSLETNSMMRRRAGRLGDIVNAGAVYSGRPANYAGDASYAKFLAENKKRPDTVFIGANDGMLHAFDATTMVEWFAYIPNILTPKLRELSLPTYVHNSYVDATAVVAEAKVGEAWKTVLVSGLGNGGQGVFALDVSNPATFGANNVLWEFTDKDDASMGNVLGRPRLLKMRTTAPGARNPVYKWFAVVTSGVNNAAPDGNASATGTPAFFILDLAKKPADSWILGTNYFKIEVPTHDATKANGLVGFAASEGSAGEAKVLYAGDLHGNFWRLDFSSLPSTKWTTAGMGLGLPFFTAFSVNAEGVEVAQPITAVPELAYAPGGGKIVSFGTGKFLEPKDMLPPFQTQTLYSVHDTNVGFVSMDGKSHKNLGRLLLQPATVKSDGTIDAKAFAWGRPIAVNQSYLRAGWYLDLPGSVTGERQVSGAVVNNSSLIFGTMEPPVSGCWDGGGRIYAMDLASGRGRWINSSVGLLSEPVVLKLGVDPISVSDSAGRSLQNTRYQIVTQGSSGIKVSALDPGIPPRSVLQRSWRQIFNFEEIRLRP